MKGVALNDLASDINQFAANTRVFNSSNTEVTEKFTITANVDQNFIYNDLFYVNLSYIKNTLNAGTYTIRTSYSINGTTVNKSASFTITYIDRTISVDSTATINSNTQDNLIHKGRGGTFTVNYSSEEDVQDELTIVVTNSSNTDVSSLFTINYDNDSIDVTLDESTNITAGDYKITVTFNSHVYIVNIHVYGDYTPTLASTLYEITRGTKSTIYVNSLSNGQLSYTLREFKNNVSNLNNGYKILDKDSLDVTNTTTNIGTGYKLVNPDDTTYTFIIIGDLNQNGQIDLGDVAKLFNYYKNHSMVSDVNIKKAADITKSGNAYPNLGDVAKLFNYYKQNIRSL